MAGRPKTRARKLAEALAAQEALNQVPTSEAGAPMPWEAPSPEVSFVRQTQKDDRANLSEWWKEQSEFMEREQEAIALVLEDAGDHPSASYARQIRRLGALGIPQDLVATMLGISEGMLLEHYEADLKQGEALMLVPVAANMIRMATSGNSKAALKAATEILSRRGGEAWRPPAQKVEITDERKTPGKGIIDSSKLSWDEREQLRAIVERQLGMRNNSTFLTNGLGAAKDNGTVIEAESDDGGEV